METENKDWKPEVGKHVWVVENYAILQKKVLRVDPSHCALLRGRRGDDFYEGFKCHPTPEAALASIKIYDLEGKEVVIPRARSIFEGDDLHRFLRDEAGQSEDVIRGWDIPHVKQIPMRTIEEQNVMLSPDGESYLIDKQEYFDWCLRNEDTLCMFLDSKIRGGAAIGGKSDQREGGC